MQAKETESGYDFGCIFSRFGLQLGTPGTHKIHLEAKNDHFGAPFGGCGPQGQIFSEFGMHFGSHFGDHFAHWRSFVATVALFRYTFCGDVFDMVSSTCCGRANVAQT